MEQINQQILSLLNVFPIEIFVFIGSIIEEFFPPIPSPLIMTTAGTLSHSKSFPLLFILFIALISSTGRTLASIIIYYLSDKLQDFTKNKNISILNFNPSDLEKYGKYFNNTYKDDLILIILRALPVVPSAPISIFCGAIKLNLRTFIVSTFIGGVIKSFVYTMVGYIGIKNLTLLLDELKQIEFFEFEIILSLLLFFSLLYLTKIYFQKKQNRSNSSQPPKQSST